MMYLIPWKRKFTVKKKIEPYTVPCRYRTCNNRVVPTRIGVKSGICDKCFRHGLASAYSRFRR